MLKLSMCGFLLLVLLISGVNYTSAQTPAGVSLLPDGIASLKPFGAVINDPVVTVVPIANQWFSKGLLVNTFNRSSTQSAFGLRADITTPLHKGDVLWISFKARSLESKRETGESLIEVRLDQLVNGKYMWPSHLERGVSIGSSWAETSIPFIMKKDAKPEDLQFVIKFDTYAQRFEMGPVTFINCGSTVKLTDLPKSVVHYEGDAPDASWRKAAAERIDKYRKGNLTIKVIDANGKLVNGADVSVRLKKNAYAWGTATNSNNLLDTIDPALKIYRDTLLKYFNKVVFENEVKSKNWARVDHNKTLKALAWLRQNNIPARGHVMVWPSWQHSPHLVPFRNDTAALRKEILKEIDDEARVLKDQFVEWDVVNEPYAQHNVMDALGGKQLMVDWFNAARKNTQGVKLFLNDFTMFHTTGNGSESFYDYVKFLVDHGAPIEGIGEQSHIGGTPPGINFLLQKLDHFATFKLPIQISEFDITSDDDDFKARYLHDYFTAIFSHPSTIGILQWGFWEGSHWMPAAALWDKNWNVRPEGKVFTELVSKTWSTDVAGKTTKNGTYTTRAFTGDYEVVVKQGAKQVIQPAVLTAKGQTITIKVTK